MSHTTLTSEQIKALEDLSLKSTANNTDVAKPSQDYRWMQKHWDLPFALMGGTIAMREAGKTYLPQNSNELNPDYKNRLQRATLTNVFKKTISNLSSKPFTKPAMLSEDMNDVMREWISDDIDREGNDVNTFSRMVLEDALIAGKSHILAEFPRISDDDGVLTLADVAARGLRPYLSHVKARAVIGWKSVMVDGVDVLTQVRIHETAKLDSGMFSEVTVNRVRVLEPGFFSLWQQDPKNKDWGVIDSGPTALDFIPLTTFYTNKEDFLVSSPPLRDLSDLNQSHWESVSDQNHVLHIARVPIMFGKGLSSGADPEGAEGTKEVTVSPNSLVHTDNPDGDLRYVEHSGSAIAAGRTHQQDLLEQMEAFSMQLLIPRSGNITATASAIDAAAANSDLQRMANELETALEQSIKYMAMLGNIDPDTAGSVEFFTDFNIAVGSVEEADLLLRMAGAGKLSTRTLLEEIKRRGLLAEQFDPEAEAEKARSDAGDTLEGMFGGNN